MPFPSRKFDIRKDILKKRIKEMKLNEANLAVKSGHSPQTLRNALYEERMTPEMYSSVKSVVGIDFKGDYV